jgi:hypothetical protein
MPPLPKRNAERRRRNKESANAKATRHGKVTSPNPPETLHPVASRWYLSLRQSGQSDFFEPSDWAAALYVAEAMTRNLEMARFSSQLFSVVWTAMDGLLTTEQARRRARVEVERAEGVEQAPPGVSAIDDYRKRMQAAQ